MAPPSYKPNFEPNLCLTFRISVWKNYVYYTPLKQNLLSLITGITFRICMKKNVMPDSLTKLNFDPSPVLELQNLCVEEFCLLYSSEPKYDPYLSSTFKIPMKKYVMPDSLTNWTLTPHLSLTLRICVWKFCMFWKLWRSVTENTSRNPSPFLIYCSLIALNSSWPAVSSTTNRAKK